MRPRSPARWILFGGAIAICIWWPMGCALVVVALLVSDDRPALCGLTARVLVPLGVVLLVAAVVSDAVGVGHAAIVLAVAVACGLASFVHRVVTGIPGRF